MSIHVTDFKWEKGKNDLEYIALLEKNLAAMNNKFKECSKLAKSQYNKGSVDGMRKFTEWCKQNNIQCRKKLNGEWIQFSVSDIVNEHEKQMKG